VIFSSEHFLETLKIPDAAPAVSHGEGTRGGYTGRVVDGGAFIFDLPELEIAVES
jgi:hypothetical protein